MTKTEFLKRLCEGYVRCYRTLNLRRDAKWSDLTQRELYFFAQLGEMLGLAASLERQKMDLCWRDLDSGELVLYLERETDRSKVQVENGTLWKLLQTEQSRRARYLAAVLGWVTEPDLLQIKQTIARDLADRSLLVIAWVGETKDKAQHPCAFVFSESRVHKRQGKGNTDEDGYWYALFPEQGKWELEEVSLAAPSA